MNTETIRIAERLTVPGAAFCPSIADFASRPLFTPAVKSISLHDAICAFLSADSAASASAALAAFSPKISELRAKQIKLEIHGLKRLQMKWARKVVIKALKEAHAHEATISFVPPEKQDQVLIRAAENDLAIVVIAGTVTLFSPDLYVPVFDLLDHFTDRLSGDKKPVYLPTGKVDKRTKKPVMKMKIVPMIIAQTPSRDADPENKED